MKIIDGWEPVAVGFIFGFAFAAPLFYWIGDTSVNTGGRGMKKHRYSWEQEFDFSKMKEALAQDHNQWHKEYDCKQPHECRHGRLARKCEVCQLADLKALVKMQIKAFPTSTIDLLKREVNDE